MPKNYTHLTTQEHAVIMCIKDDLLCSIRSIAKRLGRSASTISRELKRICNTDRYNANWKPSGPPNPKSASRKKPTMRVLCE
jgi:transposase, IS30 family